jgi:tripartite-type tricarboxylate transporter receptor subunit TctC
MTDPVLAKVPTFKEQGLDIILTTWYGIAVPKEMPLATKNKLAEGFKAMISDSEFTANLNKAGLQVEYLGPEESEAKWLSDSQELAKPLQETGMLERIKAQKN